MEFYKTIINGDDSKMRITTIKEVAEDLAELKWNYPLRWADDIKGAIGPK